MGRPCLGRIHHTRPRGWSPVLVRGSGAQPSGWAGGRTPAWRRRPATVGQVHQGIGAARSLTRDSRRSQLAATDTVGASSTDRARRVARQYQGPGCCWDASGPSRPAAHRLGGRPSRRSTGPSPLLPVIGRWARGAISLGTSNTLRGTMRSAIFCDWKVRQGALPPPGAGAVAMVWFHKAAGMPAGESMRSAGSDRSRTSRPRRTHRGTPGSPCRTAWPNHG